MQNQMNEDLGINNEQIIANLASNAGVDVARVSDMTTTAMNSEHTAINSDVIEDVVQEAKGVALKAPVVLDEDEDETTLASFPLGHTVTLNVPVTYSQGGQTYKLEEVVFSQALTGKRIRKLPVISDVKDMTWDYNIQLICGCSGLSAEAIGACQTPDLMRLMEVGMSFFANGPKVGSQQ